MNIVAHMAREGGGLTEPFIARRVAIGIDGFRSEQWSERGAAPAGIDRVAVKSRVIAPGGLGARAFHHMPPLGLFQGAEYRQIAEARKPDIIHAHYLTTGYLAAATDRPLVVSAYGFDISVIARRPLWRRAFRSLAARVGAVLVEGPYMRRAVVNLGFPEDCVRIVRIAVGHEHLTYTAPIPPGDAPRLLAAGRFVEKKGLGIAIDAFAHIRYRHPAATLEIVGAGPLDAELRRRAAASGAGAAITFAGMLPRDTFLHRVSRADLFLATSITAANGDSEGGAPTTILDAQAVGTIVVGSTHADIPFLIEDNVTGFLGPEGDTEGIADAIDRALASGQRWTEIADSARAATVAHHDDATLAQALRETYRSVLARS